MLTLKDRFLIARAVLSKPQMLRMKPSLNRFFIQYLSKFNIQNVSGNYIIHSHLPPLNSEAYTRFINEHLLARTQGPSHAQIGVTNSCMQNCVYCYNKKRSGTVLDTATIKKTIQDLKKLGVFWLGFTGGEPLLQKDLVSITDSVGDGCAIKIFTTGCGLTRQRAQDLAKAGLIYVSISLDHWQEEIHDRVRQYKGAYQSALKAIDIFKNLGSVHVSVSAVLSKEMIINDEAEEFLEFLIRLGVHEAWLSETKPSVEAFWNDTLVISEEERKKLVDLQDRYNRQGKITVNYLGHFEGREYFGCNAGHKMIYIDAFGEVSPCVFLPLSFGNIMKTNVSAVWKEMSRYFKTSDVCCINKNYKLLNKYYRGRMPVEKERSIEFMQEISPGLKSRFYQIFDE
jgi:MoaA/NifB/PqqE/SkfB family radical SAM enzyme